MKSVEFCYWLQGYFELSPAGVALTAEQTDMVRRHLNLVFKHEIDPSYGDEKQQAELNAVHSPDPLPAPFKKRPQFRPDQEPIEHLKARC